MSSLLRSCGEKLFAYDSLVLQYLAQRSLCGRDASLVLYVSHPAAKIFGLFVQARVLPLFANLLDGRPAQQPICLSVPTEVVPHRFGPQCFDSLQVPQLFEEVQHIPDSFVQALHFHIVCVREGAI